MDVGVNAYLEELVARVEARLGSRLVGVWLFGSAALGDFDAQRSDLDVQAVSSERMTAAELEELAAVLAHAALPCPARGLEFVLYAREALAEQDGPAFQLNLNTGARMSSHVSYDPCDDPRFWFVLDVAIGREQGHALAGPPADDVFPALPRPLVVESLREALSWQQRHDQSGVQVVLSACRAWAWAVDGRWLSKGAAAAWAAERLADPTPVTRALSRRDETTGPALSEAEVEVVRKRAELALGPP
jgi:hypothetical protein